MFWFWGLHILIISVIIEMEEDFFLIQKTQYRLVINLFLMIFLSYIIRNKKCKFEFKKGHEFTVNS